MGRKDGAAERFPPTLDHSKTGGGVLSIGRRVSRSTMAKVVVTSLRSKAKGPPGDHLGDGEARARHRGTGKDAAARWTPGAGPSAMTCNTCSGRTSPKPGATTSGRSASADVSSASAEPPVFLIVAGPNGSGKSSAYQDADIEAFGRSVWIINPDLLAAPGSAMSKVWRSPPPTSKRSDGSKPGWKPPSRPIRPSVSRRSLDTQVPAARAEGEATRLRGAL